MMEGILIFIFAACLHFRQIQERMFKWPVFFPHQEPWALVQLGKETCLVMWLGFSSGGWDGETSQERPLHWEALKDYCFLQGSLLLEQRGKLGHNFMSHRTTVLSEHRKWTWLLRWSQGAKIYKGFDGNASGGRPPSPFLSHFVKEEWGEKMGRVCSLCPCLLMLFWVYHPLPLHPQPEPE